MPDMTQMTDADQAQYNQMNGLGMNSSLGNGSPTGFTALAPSSSSVTTPDLNSLYGTTPGRDASWYANNGVTASDLSDAASAGRSIGVVNGGTTGIAPKGTGQIYGDPNQYVPPGYSLITQPDGDGNLHYGLQKLNSQDANGPGNIFDQPDFWKFLATAAAGAGAGAALDAGGAAGVGAGTAGADGAGTAAAGSGGLGATAFTGAGTSTLGTTVTGGLGATGGLGTLGTAGAIGAGAGALSTLGSGSTAGTGVNPSNPTGVPNTTVDPNIPTITTTGTPGGLGALTAPATITPDLSGLGTAGALTGLTAAQLSTLQNPPTPNVATGGGTVPPVVPPVSTGGNTVVPPVVVPGGTGTPGTNGNSGTNGNNTPTGNNNNTTIPSGLGGLLTTLLGGGSGNGGLGTNTGAGGLGSLLSTLYDAYSKNNIGNSLQSSFDQMNGMYKPGTPEYDDMRKRIEDRDAASGRRSQYGPREEELAASMANSRMQMLTSPGYMAMQAAMLNNQPGSGGLSGLFGSLANGGAGSLGSILNSLFSSSNTSTQSSGDPNDPSFIGPPDPNAPTVQNPDSPTD